MADAADNHSGGRGNICAWAEREEAALNIKDKVHLDFKRLGPPLFFALLAVGYMAVTRGFSDPTSNEAPMLYGSVLLALSLLVFVLSLIPSLRSGPKKARTKNPTDGFAWRQSIKIYALIAGFIALVFCVGFYVAIPVFLFLFLKFISRMSLPYVLLYAVASYAFVWLIFDWFLHLEVFTGYLVGYF
jgi:uncharacterized BrkB/YihY/UPF0761 family membrane protein